MSSLIKNIVLILCLVVFVTFISKITTFNEGFTPYIRGKYRQNIREIKNYSIDKAKSIQNRSTRFLRSVGFI
jgi:hypothetical protein